jgi:hypothetical protein
LPETDTKTACEAFLERAEQQRWKLTNMTLYGDASGNARDSTSGITDWIIVENQLRKHQPRKKIGRFNPPVKDTINAVRGKLARGKLPEVRIDPRCQTLIDDLYAALWPGNLDKHHALAWFRYFVAEEFGVKAEAAPATGTVGFSS